MTGGILGGIAVIGLSAALIFAAPSISVSAASVIKLDGADVSRLIMERLASEGLQGAPSVKPDRTFPACDSTPKIEPMFGSWSTVAVLQGRARLEVQHSYESYQPTRVSPDP